MQSKVQKWGNSLAIRIPKGMAQETGLSVDAAVDIRVSDGYLMVAPLRKPQFSLDRLLDQVSAANLHGEEDFGPAVGREVW